VKKKSRKDQVQQNSRRKYQGWLGGILSFGGEKAQKESENGTLETKKRRMGRPAEEEEK